MNTYQRMLQSLNGPPLVHFRIVREEYWGNTEYKLMFDHLDDQTIRKRATQSQMRLREGSGTAYYWFGVKDQGEVPGITPKQLEDSLSVFYSRIC